MKIADLPPGRGGGLGEFAKTKISKNSKKQSKKRAVYKAEKQIYLTIRPHIAVKAKTQFLLGG